MFSDVDYARQIGKGFRFQFMTVEKGFFAVSFLFQLQNLSSFAVGRYLSLIPPSPRRSESVRRAACDACANSVHVRSAHVSVSGDPCAPSLPFQTIVRGRPRACHAPKQSPAGGGGGRGAELGRHGDSGMRGVWNSGKLANDVVDHSKVGSGTHKATDSLAYARAA